MKFEIGKTYQHDSGQKMTIIGRLKTNAYGECLIGETDKGDLVPVGESEGHAVYWYECMRESKQETNEDCISREQAKEEIRKAFPQLKDRVEINSILNGLPSVQPKEDILDKIRADIEQKCCITVGRENDPAITLYDVFQIIDKYKEG